MDVASATAVQTIADPARDANVGGAWNADGVILVGGNPGPIERVSAGGGPREAVTSVGADQVGHRHPQFLPDGRHFLFFATGTPEVRGVYVGSLDSTDTRRIVAGDAIGGFLPPDYIMFVRQETLFAQRLDLDRLEPVGEAFLVTEPVAFDVGSDTHADVSSSATGLLAYRTATARSRMLTWFDRAGRQTGTVGGADTIAFAGMIFASHLMEVMLHSAAEIDGNQDVWLVELGRNVRRRLTSAVGNDCGPGWSPDGNRIVFNSNRSGRYRLVREAGHW